MGERVLSVEEYFWSVSHCWSSCRFLASCSNYCPKPPHSCHDEVQQEMTPPCALTMSRLAWFLVGLLWSKPAINDMLFTQLPILHGGRGSSRSKNDETSKWKICPKFYTKVNQAALKRDRKLWVPSRYDNIIKYDFYEKRVMTHY
jgi:hypothetical protein